MVRWEDFVERSNVQMQTWRCSQTSLWAAVNSPLHSTSFRLSTHTTASTLVIGSARMHQVDCGPERLVKELSGTSGSNSRCRYNMGLDIARIIWFCVKWFWAKSRKSSKVTKWTFLCEDDVCYQHKNIFQSHQAHSISNLVASILCLYPIASRGIATVDVIYRELYKVNLFFFFVLYIYIFCIHITVYTSSYTCQITPLRSTL